MKIYIMTDMEGVSGVLNFADWCFPGSRYYETGRELLTKEVNAAIEGFFAGGATEVSVADGHGAGGINFPMLDPRAEYIRGFSQGWPLMLDKSYDAVAWIGQHAKAGAEFAHLAHTQGPIYIDLQVNGVSIGEFGQFAMCASELGVRSIFFSGDRAGCLEAGALVPGIETAETKRGLMPGSGDECTMEQYELRNRGAIHIHPEKVRRTIREGAQKAIERAKKESFGIIPLKPPYNLTARFRPTKDKPAEVATGFHPTSFVALMNMQWEMKPA
jgi:D-amino peptidase